jgi:hypothetical protein
LTCQHRARCLEKRADKKIPPEVEFVCLVCRFDVELSAQLGGDRAKVEASVMPPPGDGCATCASQWTKDLRDQGIPAVRLEHTHSAVVRTKTGAETIRQLVREKQPRWDASKVAEARKKILGE